MFRNPKRGREQAYGRKFEGDFGFERFNKTWVQIKPRKFKSHLEMQVEIIVVVK